MNEPGVHAPLNQSGTQNRSPATAKPKVQVDETISWRKEKDLKRPLSTLQRSAIEGNGAPTAVEKEERSCVYIPL